MIDNFMDVAFSLAFEAELENEVPIGACIVKDGKIIGRGYNQKEQKKSIFEHAELIAIREAEKNLDNWRLDDCDIYVTLDPCPMCASAIKQARIRNVYSALSNIDLNNKKIIMKIFESDFTNPAVNFVSDLYPDKSKNILNSFFKKQRKK